MDHSEYKLTVIIFIHNRDARPIQIRNQIAVRLIDVLLRWMQIDGERGRWPWSSTTGATASRCGRRRSVSRRSSRWHGLIVETLFDVRQMEGLADGLDVSAKKGVGRSEERLNAAIGSRYATAVLELTANWNQKWDSFDIQII